MERKPRPPQRWQIIFERWFAQRFFTSAQVANEARPAYRYAFKEGWRAGLVERAAKARGPRVRIDKK